jgi:hypothetical protein
VAANAAICFEEIAMPRYYFDIQKGLMVTPDEDGLELDDLDAAECEAMRAVAALGRDLLPASDPQEVAIAVRDDYGQQVLIATVSLTIRRSLILEREIASSRSVQAP